MLLPALNRQTPPSRRAMPTGPFGLAGAEVHTPQCGPSNVSLRDQSNSERPLKALSPAATNINPAALRGQTTCHITAARGGAKVSVEQGDCTKGRSTPLGPSHRPTLASVYQCRATSALARRHPEAAAR